MCMWSFACVVLSASQHHMYLSCTTHLHKNIQLEIWFLFFWSWCWCCICFTLDDDIHCLQWCTLVLWHFWMIVVDIQHGISMQKYIYTSICPENMEILWYVVYNVTILSLRIISPNDFNGEKCISLLEFSLNKPKNMVWQYVYNVYMPWYLHGTPRYCKEHLGNAIVLCLVCWRCKRACRETT